MATVTWTCTADTYCSWWNNTSNFNSVNPVLVSLYNDGGDYPQRIAGYHYSGDWTIAGTITEFSLYVHGYVDTSGTFNLRAAPKTYNNDFSTVTWLTSTYLTAFNWGGSNSGTVGYGSGNAAWIKIPLQTSWHATLATGSKQILVYRGSTNEYSTRIYYLKSVEDATYKPYFEVVYTPTTTAKQIFFKTI